MARTPWRTSSTPSMSISTDASAKILPNFTGLTDTTVIETVLAGGCSVSSGDDPAIDRSRKGEATRQFHLMVEKPAIATPADQPPARVVRPPRALVLLYVIIGCVAGGD